MRLAWPGPVDGPLTVSDRYHLLDEAEIVGHTFRPPPLG